MRSHLIQAAVWLIGPALGTLLAVMVWHAAATYEPLNLGHAVPQISADCVTSPDDYFNACVQLDTTQIQDLRTGWDEKVCRDAAGTDCWTEHHTDDTELEIP